MRILLTGPNSFCGKVLLKLFLEKGYDVTVISRKIIENFDDNIKYIFGDLSKIDRIEHQFDHVVHIAATSPMLGITASDLIRDNVLATQNLIRLIQDCDIKKFIFFSTCSVYGTILESVLQETTPIYNPCLYGASKLMGEAMLREQTTFQSIAIRLPAVIGAGAARHWLANIIKKAKNADPITIFNPNALFNNAIHIDQLAQFVHHLMAASFNHSFDYVNVASDGGMTILQIVEEILLRLHSNSAINIEIAQKEPFTISTHYAKKHYAFESCEFSDALGRYLAEC
jgi:nucleoside-diphosphate-sugar epimerase